MQRRPAPLAGRYALHALRHVYSDVNDAQYYGPWQMHKRDIDPTLWYRGVSGGRSFYNNDPVWWQPFKFALEEAVSLQQQRAFMWSRDNIPNFSETLEVTDPNQQSTWLVLRGFWMQSQLKDVEEAAPRLDAWFRINSIIVKKEDAEKVKADLYGKNFLDPHTVSGPSTQHQKFLGEYPWHPSFEGVGSWFDEDDSWGDIIQTRHMIPFSEYEWEDAGTDHSLDSSLSFYLPAFDLVTGLQLSRSKTNFAEWVNEQEETVFIDPSISEVGPSFALIKKDVFLEWLKKNDLEILWLIGGEKQLLGRHSDYFGRLDYNILGDIRDGKIQANGWFEEQKRDEVA